MNLLNQTNIILCLLALVALAQAGPEPAGSKTKISKARANSTRLDQWKPTKIGSSSSSRSNHTSNHNFQARMMQTDQSSSSADATHHSHQVSSGLIDQNAAESWNPHSLVPTFTDQEQGDEMIALASDQDQREFESGQMGSHSDQAKNSPLSDTNRNPTESRDQIEHQKNRESGYLAQGERADISGRTSMRNTRLEELYPDEEYQDESEYSAKPMSELRQIGSVSHKVKGETAEHPVDSVVVPPPKPTNSSSTADKTNQPESAINLEKRPIISEKGWMPSAKSSSRVSSKASKVDGPARSSTAQRIAKLFGSRDTSGGPISKTDVAIEYLKNMLRIRQNSTMVGQNSSVSPERLSQSYGVESNTKNIHRLSALASRLNQILNYTTPQDQGTSSTTTSESTTQIPFEFSKQSSPVVDDALRQQAQGRGNLYTPAGTDTKFSVGDAKFVPITGENGSYRNQAIGLSDKSSKSAFAPQTYGSYAEMLDNYSTPYRQNNLHQREQNTPLAQESRLFPVSQSSSAAVRPYDPQPPVGRSDKESLSPLQTKNSPTIEQAPVDRERVEYMHMPLDNEPDQFYPKFERESRKQVQSSQTGGIEKNLPEINTHRNQVKPRGSTDVDDYHAGSNIEKSIRDTVTNGSPQSFRSHEATKESSNKAELEGYTQTNSRFIHEDERTRDSIGAARSRTKSVSALPKYTRNQEPQPTLISSKIYKDQYTHKPDQESQRLEQQGDLFRRPAPEVDQSHRVSNYQGAPKPPRIVSYNYYESPSESGLNHGELMATNYQLGDALYSSTGGVEQTLSNSELEAIHSQFMTAEHQIVPLNGDTKKGLRSDPQDMGPSFNYQNHQEPPAGALHRLNQNGLFDHNEEVLKELASNEDISKTMVNRDPLQMIPMSVPVAHQMPKPLVLDEPRGERGLGSGPVTGGGDSKDKKKSLIVYLNHPRSIDISKDTTSGESYNMGDKSQMPESFISAKEFDSQGISKENKHLDISNLEEFAELKDAQDKDGLSVVVIGDAYKYKKIVLLISSKSGGLKFIPMVKDMKK